MKQKNHPGVYLPPPLVYVAFFFLSIFIQKNIPINANWQNTIQANVIGWILIIISGLFIVSALQLFITSRNTLITIRPAKSLQTNGIYSITRNPMYLGLLLLYSGIATFRGNWWTFILIPLLILVLQSYVIRKEELYLNRAFGEEYESYRKRVRRWI